jgi:hypothetical protein
MKTTLKTIVFLLAILAAINSNAQHIIRYEMDNHNAENIKVLFVDTLSNEVIDSFYLHERNPYWNLPYDTIETGNYSVKTYKFNDIDFLTKDVIPGLIAYGPGNVSRYPGEASASHWATLSTNGQFIVTTNRLILYVYSENDFIDHASKVVTYRADGSIHHSFYSEDLIVNYCNITDDGDYYLVYGSMHDINAPHGELNLWKIIDTRNNQTILTANNETENFYGGYGKIEGNLICIMLNKRNKDDPYGPTGQGYLRCFDMVRNMVYSTLVDPINADFSMLKKITSEGIHLKSKSGKNEPDQVLRFDRDFTKQPIR